MLVLILVRTLVCVKLDEDEERTQTEFYISFGKTVEAKCDDLSSALLYLHRAARTQYVQDPPVYTAMRREKDGTNRGPSGVLQIAVQCISCALRSLRRSSAG